MVYRPIDTGNMSTSHSVYILCINYRAKDIYIYTHTHTHTHTRVFVIQFRKCEYLFKI